MNFFDAVKSGFTNYVNFNGRSSRSEYWFFVLFCNIADFCAGIADTVVVGNADSHPINTVIVLIILLPSLAVSVRRLHDLDRSGWWLLLIITGIGALVLLYWYCLAGDHDKNRFGTNPLLKKSNHSQSKN